MILTLLILRPFASAWMVAMLAVSYLFDWFCLLTKLYVSRQYVPFRRRDPNASLPSVSIIVPVADEKPEIFRRVLAALQRAAAGLDAEFFVVGNGAFSHENIEMAAAAGFRTMTLDVANKRAAIIAAATVATREIAVILDSDTIAGDDTLTLLLQHFDDPAVGGVVPQHAIFDKHGSVFRFFSHWFEDVRFNNTLRGLSARDSVSCLPGRLIAVRLERVQHYAHDFLHQTMLGTHLITGDDRVLTAYLLRDGYRTLYDNRATVLTDAPTTLRQFARQRLRWARSSFRETLLAVPWMRTRPYMAFVVASDVITRWISFAAVALMLYAWATGRLAERAELWSATGMWLVIGGSFLIGSYLRQIPHLIRHPRDFWFAPIFALISMVVLRPIEWYGNLTFLTQDWLTRNTAAAAAPRAAGAADLPIRADAFGAQPAAPEPLAEG